MLSKIYNLIFRNLVRFKPRILYNYWSLKPVSNKFGLERGKPIDRFYIERFLNKHASRIKGVCCEISDDTYIRRFGSDVSVCEVFDINVENKKATLYGDLAKRKTLRRDSIDCFILTQTLNFIYDVKSAIEGLHYMLNHNGVALVTVSGISQISRYDMDRWGDFWRFTDRSILKIFEEVFGRGNVIVESHGNVLSSKAFLDGLSAEELSIEELLYNDKDYQLVITIVAFKR